MEKIDGDEVGNLNEYTGCKIDRSGDEKRLYQYLHITHLVLLQHYHDELKLPEGRVPQNLAEPLELWM
jgi:hypothetical protein